MNILSGDQRKLIESIITEQKGALEEIAQIRRDVSTELRKAQTGEKIDKDEVYTLIERYGYLDGQISALYAQRFSQVNATLTNDQRAALIKLRDLEVVPDGAYMFSKEIPMPLIPDVGYMFGDGVMPEIAGAYDVPEGFEPSESKKPANQSKNNKSSSADRG